MTDDEVVEKLLPLALETRDVLTMARKFMQQHAMTNPDAYFSAHRVMAESIARYDTLLEVAALITGKELIVPPEGE